MAYATASDISSEFKNITFSSTTAVTDTEVTEFIDQESAYINSVIAGRYVVPVTGTESLKTLKVICIELVAMRVKRIMAVKTGNVDTSQESLSNPSKSPHTKLNEIREGITLLTDATLKNSNGGVSSYTVTNNIENTFKRNTDQW